MSRHNLINDSQFEKPDNQQERPKMIGWIVGFTDGEGCFSVSIIKNATTTLGWQIFPEFVVTQGEKSRASLEALQSFFGCGRIYINRRKDNHREHLLRYCVRAKNDLQQIIIPFFKAHQLMTAKQYDFLLFSRIINLMDKKAHMHARGMTKIARLISQMNRKNLPKFLESSETTRQNNKST